MGFKPVVLLVTFLALLFSPCIADLYAHPGGTDASGGHYNRKTGEYHQHNDKNKSSPQTKSAKSQSISTSWTGKVVGVSDGDTIKVIRAGEQVKIRLYGIDTPEKKQAFGQAAKRFTADMVAGKTVDVEPIDIDRYGRTVGLVVVDGVSLNEELVSKGYAWVYDRYCEEAFCSEWKRLESIARDNAVGLWKVRDPQAPWDWRRKN